MSAISIREHPGTPGASLPFAIAAALFLAVHASWAVSLALEHVPACITYIEGCTSISRASRREPEVYIYRALIITCGVLLVPYWRTTGTWHRLLAPERDELLRRAFVVLGVMAAVCLVVNAALLGTDMRWAIRLRKICVLIFFVGTFLAVALASISLLAATRSSRTLRVHARVQAGIVLVMLALGVLNYAVMPLVDYIYERKETVENVVEWHWVLMLCAYLAASGFAWRASGLSARWVASS